MQHPDIRDFIEELFTIKPAMHGMGGASSGILGTTGSEGVAAEKLRGAALEFMTQYGRSKQGLPSREALVQAAHNLEGALQTVKMVSGISDAKLDRLISSLHSFLS